MQRYPVQELSRDNDGDNSCSYNLFMGGSGVVQRSIRVMHMHVYMYVNTII